MYKSGHYKWSITQERTPPKAAGAKRSGKGVVKPRHTHGYSSFPEPNLSTSRHSVAPDLSQSTINAQDETIVVPIGPVSLDLTDMQAAGTENQLRNGPPRSAASMSRTMNASAAAPMNSSVASNTSRVAVAGTPAHQSTRPPAEESAAFDVAAVAGPMVGLFVQELRSMLGMEEPVYAGGDPIEELEQQMADVITRVSDVVNQLSDLHNHHEHHIDAARNEEMAASVEATQHIAELAAQLAQAEARLQQQQAEFNELLKAGNEREAQLKKQVGLLSTTVIANSPTARSPVPQAPFHDDPAVARPAATGAAVGAGTGVSTGDGTPTIAPLVPPTRGQGSGSTAVGATGAAANTQNPAAATGAPTPSLPTATTTGAWNVAGAPSTTTSPPQGPAQALPAGTFAAPLGATNQAGATGVRPMAVTSTPAPGVDGRARTGQRTGANPLDASVSTLKPDDSLLSVLDLNDGEKLSTLLSVAGVPTHPLAAPVVFGPGRVNPATGAVRGVSTLNNSTRLDDSMLPTGITHIEGQIMPGGVSKEVATVQKQYISLVSQIKRERAEFEREQARQRNEWADIYKQCERTRAELESRVAAAQLENNRLRLEQDSSSVAANAHINKLNEINSQLNAQVIELRGRPEDLASSRAAPVRADVAAEVERLNATATRLAREREALNRNIQELQDEMSRASRQAEQALAELQDQLSEANEARATLQTQFDTLLAKSQAERVSSQLGHDAAIRNLQDELRNAQARLAEERARAAPRRVDEGVDVRRDGFGQERALLMQQMEQLNDTSRREKAQAERERQSLERQLETERNDLRRARNDAGVAQREAQHARDLNASLAAELERLRQDATHDRDRLVSNAERWRQEAAEVAELRARVAAQQQPDQRTLEVLQNALHNSEAAVANLTAQLGIMQGELREAREQLRSELSIAERERARLTAALEQERGQSREATGVGRDAEAKIAELTAQIRKERRVFDAERSRLLEEWKALVDSWNEERRQYEDRLSQTNLDMESLRTANDALRTDYHELVERVGGSRGGPATDRTWLGNSSGVFSGLTGP